MAITKTRQLHEVLFRFAPDSSLQGAHVIFADVIDLDDGSAPVVRPGAAESIAVAGNAGHDLSEIMSDVLVQAVTHGDCAQAKADALDGLLATEIERGDALYWCMNDMLNKVVGLESQIAALQSENSALSEIVGSMKYGRGEEK